MLKVLFAGILLLRRPRPIHVRGRVLEGHVTWLPGAKRSGIAWVDDASPTPVPVVARLSRSIGLPSGWPDVLGLALRMDIDDRPIDIELASTGRGVPGRFALTAHGPVSRAWFGTLFPYRSSCGPVLIGARQVSKRTLPTRDEHLDAVLVGDGWRIRLYHATPMGLWHPYAEVSLRMRVNQPRFGQDSAGPRFDSVRNALPGAGTYGWVRALRQPSYRMVQGTDGVTPG